MKLSALVLLALMPVLPALEEDVVVEKSTKTSFKKSIGDNPKLNLMGVAPRIKNVLGVYGAKVYGVGLYADPEAIETALGGGNPSKIRLAAAIIATSGRRALVLKFVRDLKKDVMENAFKEAIERTIPINDPKIADDAKRFLAAFVDITKGDEAMMYFQGNKITLYGNGLAAVTVENRSLARALLASYVGINPIDDKIKNALLAKKP